MKKKEKRRVEEEERRGEEGRVRRVIKIKGGRKDG